MQHRKTKINPLKSLGLRPGAWVSAGAYKSRLLTPQPTPNPHLLSEGLQPLQGDKQEINPIQLKSSLKTNGSTQRNDAPLQRKMCLFPVYRLEEAEGLLKEGGVWVSDGALRACSYKTQPKPKLQGEAP